MTDIYENNLEVVYGDGWTFADVDLCTDVILTDTQKSECLEELVELLCTEIGMEYLREIVENKIKG